MDYLAWSKEYADEAQRVQRSIERLKNASSLATGDERKRLCGCIITLREIYYECVHTAKLLYERSGAADAA